VRAIVFPIVGPTTVCSPFGDPRGTGSHHGIDICAPMGTPVLAPDSGDVRFGTDPKGGIVALVDGDGGGTWYLAHLQRINGANRSVAAGDVVGFVGMTGNASTTLPHTHVEAWPTGDYTSYIDPTPLLATAQRFSKPPAGAVRPLTRGQALLVGAGVVGFSALLAWAMTRRSLLPSRSQRSLDRVRAGS